jgi:hypothetical protein
MFARLVNTLSICHSSNTGLKSADNVVTISIAEPRGLLRSEFKARMRGVESERVSASNPVTNVHPLFLQHSVSCTNHSLHNQSPDMSLES